MTKAKIFVPEVEDEEALEILEEIAEVKKGRLE